MEEDTEDTIIHNCIKCGEAKGNESKFNWNEDETLSCGKCGRKAYFVHEYKGKSNTYAFDV